MKELRAIVRWLQHAGVTRATGRRRPRNLQFEDLEPRLPLSTIQRFDGTGTAYSLYQNANAPAAEVVAGGPTGSFLRLVSATNNPPIANVLSFPRSDTGAVDQVMADFDFRMTPGEELGGAGRADGFGFAFLNTAAYGITAANSGGTSEEPNFTASVGIGFDIYQNDDLGDIGNDIVRNNYSNSISIHFNGQVIQQFDATPIVDLASGEWIHAHIVIRAKASLGDVSVVLTPADGIAVTLVDRLKINGLVPYEGKIYFGGRAGGESGNHDLDNVTVQYSNYPSLAAGVLEFASATVSSVENSGVATLAVTRRLGSTGLVTVGYYTLDGSAQAGLDYAATMGTLTFAAGEVGPKTITVPLIDDDQVENIERLTVRLTSATGGALIGVAGDASLGILDNEGTGQDFDSAAGTSYVAAQHAGGPAPLVTSGGPSRTGSFLRLASIPDPGAANQNSISFAATMLDPPQVVIADFDLRMIPIVGRADGLGFALLDTAIYGTTGPVPPEAPFYAAEEPNFRGSLGIGFDIYNSNKTGVAHPDIDINELDIHNIVSLHFAGALLGQFDATPIVDLASGQWNHVRITVEKSPSATSSLVSVDLTPCGGCIPVRLIDRFEVAGMTPYVSRAWFGARSGGLAAQHDLDGINIKTLGSTESLFSLSSASYSALEGGDALLVTVNRSGNTSAPATVQYDTANGSALSGTDYVAASGTLQFAAGETSRTFLVTILNDGQTEADPFFKIKLSQPANGSFLGGPFAATATIFDDETAAANGHWSLPVGTSIAAVHAHLLPSGKIIYWDRRGEIRLFDPVTMTIGDPANPGMNLFCGGETFLASGQLLVAGGHHHGGSPADDGMGLDTAVLYDFETNTWEMDIPTMNAGRWYPTATTLGSGDVLVISGSIEQNNGQYIKNPLPQVFETGTHTWRDLTAAGAQQEAAPAGAAPLGGDLYPRMFLLPDGRVFKAGPDKATWILDTTGQGNWIPGPASNYGFRGYGTAVMYAPGKIMIAGGGQANNANIALHATATVEVIDFNSPNPVWRTVTPMHFARRQLDATLLPTGKVLVTGGVGGPGFNNEVNAVFPAELWDPATETWTALPAMDVVRGYHSTALLMPDGRVMVGGGGQGANALSFENNAQFYSPAYLFHGQRPAILDAPTATTYGQSVRIETSTPANISELTLLPIASVTHAFDFNNRFISLGRPQVQAGGLMATFPTNPNVMPPGFWMMFAISDQGVPSVGQMIQIVDPFSADDQVAADEDAPTTLRIQDNDVILSGQALAVLVTTPPLHGTLTLNADGSQTYVPFAGYVGADSFQYQATDPTGHPSNKAMVRITVCSKAWSNLMNMLDVNNDGEISPIDALLVINEINAHGSHLLPPISSELAPPPFLDTNCDGFVSAIDALLVINRINGANH